MGSFPPGQCASGKTADDPRYTGALTRIEYTVEPGNFGMISKEKNLANGAELVRFQDIGSGRMRAIYANGRVQEFYQPDAGFGNVHAYKDGLNRETSSTYADSGAGFLLSRTDPLGRTTSWTRNSLGQPLSITHPDGSVETWTRDDLGLPLTRTLTGPGLPAARTTTWTRDADHRVTRIDHPDSTFETFTRNTFGQVLTHTHRDGGTTTRTYDSTGLLLTETNPLGNTTTFTYNSQSLVATATNPRGFTTSYTYNARGQLIQTTHPDTSTTAATYDVYGNRLTLTNELNHTWSWTYDEFRRPVTSTDPLNRTTLRDYALPGSCGCPGAGSPGGSPFDKPAKITLPSGRSTEFYYDVEWQLTSRIDAPGTADEATTLFTYDAAGNLLTTTDPRGKVWTSTFNNRNWKATAKDPLNNTTAYVYDAAGNVLTETFPDATQTTHTYDAMNRRLTTTNASAETTAFAYDASGNMVTLTDAKSNTYAFDYDLLNRRTRFTYPGGSYEEWTYHDTAGVSTPSLVYRTRSGVTMSCTTDNRGRDTICDWSDSTPDFTKTYDDAGRLLTLADC